MPAVFVFLSSAIVLVLVVHLQGGHIENVDGGEANREGNPGDVEEAADYGHNKFELDLSLKSLNQVIQEMTSVDGEHHGEDYQRNENTHYIEDKCNDVILLKYVIIFTDHMHEIYVG